MPLFQRDSLPLKALYHGRWCPLILTTTGFWILQRSPKDVPAKKRKWVPKKEQCSVSDRRMNGNAVSLGMKKRSMASLPTKSSPVMSTAMAMRISASLLSSTGWILSFGWVMEMGDLNPLTKACPRSFITGLSRLLILTWTGGTIWWPASPVLVGMAL